MTLTNLINRIPGGMAVAIGGLGLVALVACGSGGQAATKTVDSAPSVPSVPVAAQELGYQIVGPEEATVVGPDGAKHDVFFAVSSTSVKVGVPVTITITNKDASEHSMTSPDLGFNIVVPAATDKGDGTISYTFTPTTAGSFRWFCAIPCDSDNAGWDMTSDGTGNGQNNFMAGFITVTS